MKDLKIGIILGSTREGRVSPQVGKWVKEIAELHDQEASYEIVDIKDYKLPLLGESNDFFAKYKSEEKIEVKDSAKEPDTASTDKKYSTEEMVKKVLGYVKKINPDTVTKTVTSIQKVMELMGSFGGGATASAVAAKKSTLDPLFDRRFDEWY